MKSRLIIIFPLILSIGLCHIFSLLINYLHPIPVFLSTNFSADIKNPILGIIFIFLALLYLKLILLMLKKS